MTAINSYDRWTAFALLCIRDSLVEVNRLGRRGTEVVSTIREEGYRYWDPETLRVDQAVEDLFIARLKEYGIQATVLSEEAQRLEVAAEQRQEGLDEPVYFVSDPFDGSLLYKRHIPAFWFTSLAIYSLDGQPKCAAVGDCIEGRVDFADSSGAYTGHFVGEDLVDVEPIHPATTRELGQAFLETYLMKPYYVYPTVLAYEPLLRQVKFILPNGGPAGFSDVAKGRVDIYLAIKQPFVDVFPGLFIAQQAGAVVTTFQGEEIAFSPDLNRRYDIVCSATRELHQQVLAQLAEITSQEA
jgi:fructose-1,6-bisphosphatase/inositol monophosphatase family enzyme